MKPDGLGKELTRGTIRPGYLLAGKEALFRDDAQASIRRAVLDGAADDFNLDRLMGEQTSAAALLDSVRCLPVMASHRLVILTEPEHRRGAESKKLTEALAAVLDEIRGQQETVLIVNAAKADRRLRWVKAFSEPAVVVDCEPLRAGKPLLSFIAGEAKRQGIELESGAAQLLAERIGPQLGVLRNEIAKLVLLVGPEQKAQRADVARSANDLADQSIWDLTDAIGEGRAGAAVSQLGRLLASGKAPQAILATLAGHFRKLSRVRDGGAVAGQPFIVRKLQSQAGRYSRLGLRRGLEAIHQADLDLKGANSLPAELTLESLILDLVS